MSIRDRELVEARRARVRNQILEDHDRRAFFGGFLCEGQLYKPHDCLDGFQLNEIIYPRRVFQKMCLVDRLYFYSVINCGINCPVFHEQDGHSYAYRVWFEERMREFYGDDVVTKWIENSPLKIKVR